MLGACYPTNVGASATNRAVSAQVKLLKSVVADESITEELSAFLSQLVFGERQLRQRAHDRHEVRKKHAALNADVSLTQVDLRDGVVAHNLHRNVSYLARAGAGDSHKQ